MTKLSPMARTRTPNTNKKENYTFLKNLKLAEEEQEGTGRNVWKEKRKNKQENRDIAWA